MQQYFVKGTISIGSSVFFSREQLHHIRHVMRMKEGDLLRLADEAAHVFLAQLRSVEGSYQAMVIEELKVEKARVHITLAAALIKGERWDYMCQKCSELGVSKIQPLITSRCVVKLQDKDIAKKQARWNRITMEACEQCKRSDLVMVDTPCDLNELLACEAQLKLLAYEHADAKSDRLLDIVHRYPDVTSILCVIGPEGGFHVQEAQLLSDNGFLSVSLGPRILRAETAALSIVNVLSLLYNS